MHRCSFNKSLQIPSNSTEKFIKLWSSGKGEKLYFTYLGRQHYVKRVNKNGSKNWFCSRSVTKVDYKQNQKYWSDWTTAENESLQT